MARNDCGVLYLIVGCCDKLPTVDNETCVNLHLKTMYVFASELSRYRTDTPGNRMNDVGEHTLKEQLLAEHIPSSN
jgi:hypothetical protein